MDHQLTDKGEIVERSAPISLSRNIRFAFRLYGKVFDHKPKFDVDARWVACSDQSKLVIALPVPEIRKDSDVLASEPIQALEARQGVPTRVGAEAPREPAPDPADQEWAGQEWSWRLRRASWRRWS